MQRTPSKTLPPPDPSEFAHFLADKLYILSYVQQPKRDQRWLEMVVDYTLIAQNQPPSEARTRALELGRAQFRDYIQNQTPSGEPGTFLDLVTVHPSLQKTEYYKLFTDLLQEFNYSKNPVATNLRNRIVQWGQRIVLHSGTIDSKNNHYGIVSIPPQVLGESISGIPVYFPVKHEISISLDTARISHDSAKNRTNAQKNYSENYIGIVPPLTLMSVLVHELAHVVYYLENWGVFAYLDHPLFPVGNRKQLEIESEKFSEYYEYRYYETR